MTDTELLDYIVLSNGKQYPRESSKISICITCKCDPKINVRFSLFSVDGYFVRCECGKKTSDVSSDSVAIYNWNHYVNVWKTKSHTDRLEAI